MWHPGSKKLFFCFGINAEVGIPTICQASKSGISLLRRAGCVLRTIPPVHGFMNTSKMIANGLKQSFKGERFLQFIEIMLGVKKEYDNLRALEIMNHSQSTFHEF